MKRHFSGLFLLLFSCGQLLSQAVPPNSPQSMIPPSPTAYALGKYGDLPVSLYTGVPNVSVPLYTVKSGDVSVDVSLSYHGSGIKVDEAASYAGLGWSLNAGGMITRVVRGKVEYLSPGGAILPTRANIHFHQLNETIEDLLTANDFETVIAGGTDSEPDEFYYNFNGRSGKFSFDANKNVRFNKDEPMEVNWIYVNGNYTRFVLKDELGVTYEFTDYEATSNPGEISYQSAWYLTKVTSPTGNIVNFEYYNTNYTQYNRSYSKQYHRVHPTNTDITPPIYDIPFQGSTIWELRLKKISFDNGYVQFDYKSTARQDGPTGASPALEYVSIFRSSSDCVKKIKLTTSYFEANDAFKYSGWSPTTFAYLNYRLRLDAVQEFSGDGLIGNPPYTFSYAGDNNATTDDLYTLPYRLSPAQDHWGYFNHAQNPHLMPGRGSTALYTDDWYTEFTAGDDPQSTNAPLTAGANRAVDTVAIKACMLTRITYPTGGHTDLVFEDNFTIANTGGLHIKKITDQPLVGSAKETNYSYTGGSTFDPTKYYFEYYSYDQSGDQTTPGRTVLDAIGIPYTLGQGSGHTDMIAITTQPQAILGPGARVGFYSVTVQQIGNGKVTSIFAYPGDFDDYSVRDVFNEGTSGNLMVDELFLSEAVSNIDPAQVIRKTTCGVGRWPYPENYSNDWKRGVPILRMTFAEGEVLLKEENFEYERTLLSAIPAFKVVKFTHGQYLYAKYLIPNARILQKKVETKDYDQNGQNPVVSTVEYFYDNPSHLQPTRIQKDLNNGKKQVMLTTYPGDYASGTNYLDDMKAAHLLAYPVEQVSYLDDGSSQKIQSGSIKKYKTLASGLKTEEFALETSQPIPLSSFKFSNRATGVLPSTGTATSFAAYSGYVSKLLYDSYDTKGNPKQITPNNNNPVSYLWGYNKTYPIAQVTNATVDQVDYTSFENNELSGWTMNPGSVIYQYSGRTGRNSYGGVLYRTVTVAGKYVITLWGYRWGTQNVNGNAGTVIRTYGNWALKKWVLTNPGLIEIAADQLDELRFYPEGALMTTYTYDPLIGMTSRSDANGNITFYEYDEYGRLILIRDDEENILKKYCYNYSGQTESCEVFYNESKSQYFTPACGVGGTGTSIEYYVYAKKYLSTVSQLAANQLAQNEINLKGQAYANEKGTCTYYNQDLSTNYYSQNCTGGGQIAQPYYVSVPAGGYSSTSSLAAANALAIAYAQGQADAYGSCTPPIELYYSNYASSSDLVYLTLIDENMEYYYFELPASSGGSLGSVPPGDYTVHMYGASMWSSFHFMGGCDPNTYSGNDVWFPVHVTINSFCNTFSAN